MVVISVLGSLATERSVGQAPKAVGTGYDAERARALYVRNCSACHGVDGGGHPGVYPPIKGSGVVIKDDAAKHIKVVLNGVEGAKAGGVLYTNPMPPFGGILDDADLADIIDYERSSWGNHGKLVTAAQVAAQRRDSK